MDIDQQLERLGEGQAASEPPTNPGKLISLPKHNSVDISQDLVELQRSQSIFLAPIGMREGVRGALQSSKLQFVHILLNYGKIYMTSCI